MQDYYLTIENTVEDVIFKDKNSKFYGFCYPINSENEVKDIIDKLRKKHYQANHFCYAYNLGFSKNLKWRANDDGEPNHSAGSPILGQINSKEITNVLVVVVRYFGGTKLGVSGLINAYKNTALLTLNASKIISKSINLTYDIEFTYQDLNKLMRFIKENKLQVINQNLSETCFITIEVKISMAEKIENILKNELKLKF